MCCTWEDCTCNLHPRCSLLIWQRCVGAGLTGVAAIFGPESEVRRGLSLRDHSSSDCRVFAGGKYCNVQSTVTRRNFNGIAAFWAGKCCFQSPHSVVYVPDFLSPVTCPLPLPFSLHLPFDPLSRLTHSLRAIVSPALWLPTFICCSHSPSLSLSFFLPPSVPRRVLSPSFFLFLRGLTHSLDQVNVNLRWPLLHVRFLNQSRRHQRVERFSRCSPDRILDSHDPVVLILQYTIQHKFMRISIAS